MKPYYGCPIRDVRTILRSGVCSVGSNALRNRGGVCYVRHDSRIGAGFRNRSHRCRHVFIHRHRHSGFVLSTS